MLQFLSYVILGVWSLGLSVAMERKPNVILILADDLGYQDLGCYGHPLIRTPVLDGLAKEGVRLTGFHAGATVCTPSRMALVTGMYPVRLGWLQGVVGYKMGLRDGLNPEAVTIGEVFKKAGYVTAISGKWHIGSLPECRPHRQGFDSAYYLPLSNNQTNEIWREDEIVEKPFDNRLLTEQFTDEAIGFIKKHRASPFFLYLPYSAPHFPVEPHPDWKGRSKFGDYGDVVEELDHSIGRVMKELKTLGIDQQTLVVFASDNGPQKGQAAKAEPFRGQKWSPLEGGTRVPCIVHFPGVLPAGRECDTLVSAMDLLPTLARACGIDWKGAAEIDGMDLWDSLLGKDGAIGRSELLHWHGMESEPQAIRVGDWKLFFDRRHALGGLGAEAGTPDQLARLAAYQEAAELDSVKRPFLVNLREDPGETIDLSGKFPDKVEAFRTRAAELMAELRASETLPLATPR